MAQIRPFRALRYSPAAGPLERLVAPPYDVISAEEHYAAHPELRPTLARNRS